MIQPIFIIFAMMIGFALGALVAWFMRQTTANDYKNALEKNNTLQLKIDQALNRIAELCQSLGSAESTVNAQKEQITEHVREKNNLATQKEGLIIEQQRLSNRVTELASLLEAEQTQSYEKLQLLKNAEEQLSNRFKTLANDILEDKTKRFTEQNQTNLHQLLEPLKVKITEFQGKVQEVYMQEGKDRSALAEQVKQLMALNNQLSGDAHNLTRALKGQAKAQGNWGEVILERVLEMSGLRKGHEYDTQENHTREDGSRGQLDVVLHLPEDKHLIIDAKMSLIAYEDYVNNEQDNEREIAIKRHIESVRGHIKGLSDKNYQLLYGLKSLDFVLMFIPIEPAFMLAISHDSQLWQEAWKKNVLLVSPSTLLFVVRTIAHLWRQEQLNRNSQEISKRGSELYDKFVGFVADLDDIGKHIEKAQKAYEGAYSKIKSGRGNLIGQAHKLVALGIKPSKTLPASMIELAEENNEELSE